MTGVDLGFVPVVRVPESRTSAQEARAYTRAGVVHLPESAPPVDSVATQALIAHELTHVLQQRALGDRAREDGPMGPALEAQAEAVERAHLGQEVPVEQLDWPTDFDLPSPGLSWSPETGFVSTDDVFESWIEDPAPAGAQRAPALGGSFGAPPPIGPPMSGGAPEIPDFPTDSIVPLAYPEPDDSDDGESEESPDQPQDRTLSPAEIARVAAQVRAGLAVPALNPKDPELLDALARGLYGRLRTSLRGELLSDRERSGQFTEFQ